MYRLRVSHSSRRTC